jgi:hypothetical protein
MLVFLLHQAVSPTGNVEPGKEPLLLMLHEEGSDIQNMFEGSNHHADIGTSEIVVVGDASGFTTEEEVNF